MFEIFTTNVGSHMWKMDHDYSDIDLATVYIQDSKDFLLGKQAKGKQVINEETNTDVTYYELGRVINYLLKGNVNYIWAVMSPIIVNDIGSSLKELRGIVGSNVAKNCFNSINGMARHNIYHYIEKKGDTSYKRLNVIGRTIQFGINALMWGKYMFEKTEIENVKELYDLKEILNNAYNTSALPEKPDPRLYESYLIKWRIKRMRKEGFI